MKEAHKFPMSKPMQDGTQHHPGGEGHRLGGKHSSHMSEGKRFESGERQSGDRSKAPRGDNVKGD